MVRHESYEDIMFFFNDTATTEIYTLSLHDALPIYRQRAGAPLPVPGEQRHVGHRVPAVPHPEDVVDQGGQHVLRDVADRKSTRLNSSHANISYAVFCLKKKKNNTLLLFHSFTPFLF